MDGAREMERAQGIDRVVRVKRSVRMKQSGRTEGGGAGVAGSLRMSATGALLVTLLAWGSAAPDSPVADAAMRGDIEAVRTLVGQGADVNSAQGDGMTALHWAAERGDDALARLLVHAGASVYAVTRLGDYTPLHLASKAGRAAVISTLLEAGADPTAKTTTGGATALHFAAGAGSAESVTALLARGADADVRESSWGQTPLMFAASAGRIDAARALIAHGADVSLMTEVVDLRARAEQDAAAGDVRNQVLEAFRGDQPPGTSWQPTPDQVQAAVRAANSVIAGADPESPPAATEPDRPTGAAYEDEPPADQDLGMRPSSPGGEDEYDNSYESLVAAQGGLTALLHAVREGQAEVAFLLLDAGADIDQPSGGDHTSPLLMATINGHFDLAVDLLERGADPDVASHAGATPLFAAINTYWAPKARYPQQQAYLQQQATHLDVMRALLEAGADPNIRLTKHIWYMEYTFSHLGIDMRGATAFWRAAHALDLEAMKLLVAYDADRNLPTLKEPERRRGGGGEGGDQPDPSGLPPVPPGGAGVWPIHAATGHGYGTGYAGNSHRHVPEGWLPAVRYLVDELGADVNARDADGFSPVHNAAARGDNEVIRFLVERGADVTVVSRRGHTTVDMANGPQQRIQPFPETIALLEGLGAKNNHNCVSC